MERVKLPLPRGWMKPSGTSEGSIKMPLFFKKLLKILPVLAFVLVSFCLAHSAQAYERNYYNRVYGTVGNGPLLYSDGYGDSYIFYRGKTFPTRLRGVNDSFYQFDNIYGPGASAALRMGRVTRNVPRVGPYGAPY